MAAQNYEESLRRMLVHEGGYTNHPSDPGGPTNWGITIHDYRKYVNPEATAADVRTMPLEIAKKIYRAKYWNAMRCDELPAGVDYAVFDYGVNSGIGRAPKVLQRILGCPVTDRVDDVTIRVAKLKHPCVTAGAICDERMHFLQSLRTWPVFGEGWGKRVREVKAAALHMADRTVAVRPEMPTTPGAGKATPTVNQRGQVGSTAGAVVTGVTAASQTHSVTIAVVILLLTAAAAVGAWFYWHWRQKQQQEGPV